MEIRTRTVLAAMAIAGTACAGRSRATKSGSPEFDAKNDSICGGATHTAEPLVVEWPSEARAKLESLARKGVVVVSYRGCELKVLSHCKAPGSYSFSPITRTRDVVKIRDLDELYANVPVGAAKLKSKLQSSGQLNVAMTIVGRYEVASAKFGPSQLEGDCEGATHVIAGLTTGSFKLFAGANAAGKSTSHSELLNEGGDEATCAQSSSADSAPPDGCGAIVRVEVIPLGQAKTSEPACPPGTKWNDKQCLAIGVSCPSGSYWDGGKCVGTSPAAPWPSPECVNDPADCTAKCTAGNANSCLILGAMYETGRGGLAVDKAKAAVLYKRACDGGAALACAGLGVFYERGEGGLAVDKAKAVALAQRACDGGSDLGCYNLAVAYERGDGGLAVDKAKAVTLYQRACNAGLAQGCARVKSLNGN
jgi:hypothetical protein